MLPTRALSDRRGSSSHLGGAVSRRNQILGIAVRPAPIHARLSPCAQLASNVDNFPQRRARNCTRYIDNRDRGQALRAIPRPQVATAELPSWILGSSLEWCAIAPARLGPLPYAFAFRTSRPMTGFRCEAIPPSNFSLRCVFGQAPCDAGGMNPECLFAARPGRGGRACCLPPCNRPASNLRTASCPASLACARLCGDAGAAPGRHAGTCVRCAIVARPRPRKRRPDRRYRTARADEIMVTPPDFRCECDADGLRDS